MKIKLTKNTDCAHDIHEITKYPRDWYKILRVKSRYFFYCRQKKRLKISP